MAKMSNWSISGIRWRPEHISYSSQCQCITCRMGRSKQERLERTAAQMREKNLFHGKGCATKRAAIAKRLAEGSEEPFSFSVGCAPGR